MNSERTIRTKRSSVVLEWQVVFIVSMPNLMRRSQKCRQPTARIAVGNPTIPAGHWMSGCIQSAVFKIISEKNSKHFIIGNLKFHRHFFAQYTHIWFWTIGNFLDERNTNAPYPSKNLVEFVQRHARFIPLQEYFIRLATWVNTSRFFTLKCNKLF